MPSPLQPWIALLCGACALAALACTPKVGDACTTAADCSSVGELLCDTSYPGGYCTNSCEPGTCPEDAVCVSFRFARSIEATCNDPQQPSPYERTFCMATCEDDGDCRDDDDYACIEVAPPSNLYGAAIIDTSPAGNKFCALPYPPGVSAPTDRDTGVCTGAAR